MFHHNILSTLRRIVSATERYSHMPVIAPDNSERFILHVSPPLLVFYQVNLQTNVSLIFQQLVLLLTTIDASWFVLKNV